MNKKFLSAILFGALMVASTGTFVSCKDYDDDINDLQEQIDAQKSDLSSQISALQAALASARQEAASAAAEAKTAADNAAKEAAAAKQAAAEAKEAAIADAAAKVEALKSELEGKLVSKEVYEAKVAEIAAEISAIETGLNTLTTKVDANASAIAQLQNQVAALENFKTLIEAYKLDDKFAAIDDAIDALNEGMKSIATTDALNAVDQKLENLAAEVAKINQNLVTILAQELRSLVFYPELYVGGLEATEYGYAYYNYYTAKVTGDTKFTDDQGLECTIVTPETEWAWTKVAGYDVYNPVEFVKYHMNPSSAVVKELADLSFSTREVQTISRANSSELGFKVESMEQKKDGFLTVGYTLNADAELLAEYQGGNGKDGESSIFALEAKVRRGEEGDTTITSDYAMAYVSQIVPQVIAYKSNEVLANELTRAELCAGKPYHLYATVEAAIAGEPTLNVGYQETLDLTKLLTIHYNWDSEVKASKGTHKVWEYGQEAKYGFKYDFMLIDYVTGTNLTSDSKYAVASQIANGIVDPSIVDANGNTLGKDGISSVGKRPLVRVRVLDSANKVVLSGYIKLQILKDPGYKVVDNFDRTYKFGCDAGEAALTWSEISYELLEMTATQSKDEFDALYKFSVDAAGEGIQYIKSGDKWIESTNKVGVVEEQADPTGTTNSVLVWTLSMEEMQSIYENADHKHQIFVRYESAQGETANAPIYVPLTAIITKPVGAVKTKLDDYWYDGGTTTRLNVNYPADGGNTKTFVRDLNQAWAKVNGTQKPEFAPTAGFASYTDAIFATQNGTNGGYKYYFTEQNNGAEIPGTNYKLWVDEVNATDIFTDTYEPTYANTLKYALKSDMGVYTNTSLMAGVTKASAVEIATIDQATGEITYIFDNDDEHLAKILLNLYPHNDAKLIAHVGICAYTECGIVMATEGNTYPNKILRPIDVVDANNGKFTDAEHNGSKVDLASLLKFNDWRNEAFVTDDYANVWYFAYYNVKKIEVDIENITTDMKKGGVASDINTTLLSSLTDKVLFSHIDATGADISTSGATLNYTSADNTAAGSNLALYEKIVKAMGQIKYENNGNNVQKFNVRIPLKITYDWGIIETVKIDCAVVNTMGN